MKSSAGSGVTVYEVSMGSDHRWLLIPWALFFAVNWLHGDAVDVPADPEVTALIKRLGDEEFQNRERAGAELEKFGDKAVHELQKAANKHPDAEIRWRANHVFHRLTMFSRTTGMELVPLAAAEFSMGSPEHETSRSGDEVVHRVKISKLFLLGKYEVTQGEFAKVMERNPSAFSASGAERERVAGKKTESFPVENVSWWDAIEYCNRLSNLDGYAPYYELTDVQRNNVLIVTARVSIRGGNGYRLPTEAEWEYACRAGTSSRFSFGNTATGQEANIKPGMLAGGYGGAVPKFTHLARSAEVGTYPPNPWQLCEMHGNVAEWCWDVYDKDYYASSPLADPLGPPNGIHRVVRGGSWMIPEEGCRSTARFWQTPDERKYHTGFRVARTM